MRGFHRMRHAAPFQRCPVKCRCRSSGRRC